jgi:hypothetical protein
LAGPYSRSRAVHLGPEVGNDLCFLGMFGLANSHIKPPLLAHSHFDVSVEEGVYAFDYRFVSVDTGQSTHRLVLGMVAVESVAIAAISCNSPLPRSGRGRRAIRTGCGLRFLSSEHYLGSLPSPLARFTSARTSPIQRRERELLVPFIRAGSPARIRASRGTHCFSTLPWWKTLLLLQKFGEPPPSG